MRDADEDAGPKRCDHCGNWLIWSRAGESWCEFCVPCTHCEEPVRPDGRGDWIHVRGLYRCQSSAVAYGHLAHPVDVPCRADGPNPCLGARVTSPGGGRA